MTEDELKAIEELRAASLYNMRNVQYSVTKSLVEVKVPALIAEVRRLRNEVEGWRRLNEKRSDSFTPYYEPPE